MSRQFKHRIAFLLLFLASATGCHPTQPFYMHEDGDLSHYLDKATRIEYADVDQISLAEVEQARAPFTLRKPGFREYWDLTIEDAVSIALQNSKVIRNLGSLTQFTIADGLVGRTATGATVYDPAVFESDPQFSVAAALSEFDASFTAQAFYDKTDRLQNLTESVGPGGRVIGPEIRRDTAQIDFELNKRTAAGTIFSFTNSMAYDRSSFVGFGRSVPSDWLTDFGVQATQPLLRNRGAQVNRAPVVIARIRTDISLYDFRASIRNMMMDLESAYWDLHFAYRSLFAAQIGRDSALTTWRIVNVKLLNGKATKGEEAQSREQYFFFRNAMERSLRDVFNFETRLRWLMGLSPTDGRLIRPIDEPTVARVDFTWGEIHVESQVRNEELNRQRWVIKQREQEMVLARNQLLPQLDFVARYGWIGQGQNLIQASRTGLNPVDDGWPGTNAYETLTTGRYHESRIGLTFTPPRIGARQELAGIQNAKLNLVRDKARLEDMELNVAHLLTTAVQNLEFNYQSATTNLNRLKAASDEVRVMDALYQGDRITLDRVLEAQRRRSAAMADYYRAITDYNKSVSDVHFRKGSLLEHNNVQLAEGPWQDKAYWDAMGRARERDASYYWDYGYTRPGVVSRGPYDQNEMQLPPGELIPTPAGEEPLPLPNGGNELPMPMDDPGMMEQRLMESALDENGLRPPLRDVQFDSLNL